MHGFKVYIWFIFGVNQICIPVRVKKLKKLSKNGNVRSTLHAIFEVVLRMIQDLDSNYVKHARSKVQNKVIINS